MTMSRLVFRSDVLVLPQGEARDSVLLYRRTKPSLRLRRAGADLLSLVERIQAGVDRHLIAAEDGVGAWGDELVRRLEAGGFLASDQDRNLVPARHHERFDRLLAYFSAFETATASRFTYLARLLRSRVLLVGVGSLGSWTLYHLASNAIAEIHGVDGDRVELSNLSRQIVYRTEDVGQPKVAAAQRAVAAYTDASRFVGHDQFVDSERSARALVETLAPDLVILTADTPRLRIGPWFAEACVANATPLLRANALGVGPLWVPGQGTACPQCDAAPRMAPIPDTDRIMSYRQGRRDGGLLKGPVISILPGIYSTHVASEVVAFLAGYRSPATIGARLIYDPATGQSTRTAVGRNPTCTACGRT
jgi:bacteriocin biosynthesis cyclodehydratase domain-containing protein